MTNEAEDVGSKGSKENPFTEEDMEKTMVEGIASLQKCLAGWASQNSNSSYLPLLSRMSSRIKSTDLVDMSNLRVDVESNYDIQAQYQHEFGPGSEKDDSDGDFDATSWFPCPFCYWEIEMNFFCVHLQEEHCFDLKNGVCPLCAANLGKDPTTHFIVHHSGSLKNRRRSQKSDNWSGVSTMLGGELGSFLDSSNHERSLLEFVPEVDNASDVKSTEPRVVDECQEKNKEEKREKAAFVQELVMSTIFEV